MELLKRFIRLLWLEHREIKLVLAYGVGFSFLNLIFPLGAQAILSNLNYGTVLQPIIIVAVLVFGVLGLSSVLRSFQVYLIEIIQRRIFSRITLSIGVFIPKTKAGAFDVELMNRFFEVVNVQKTQYLILMDGLGTILQTLLGLLLLAFYHPYLFIFDLLFVAGIYVIMVVLSQGGIETSVAESKEKYKVASWLEELTRNKKIFSRRAGMQFALQRTDESILDYLHKREKHFKILFRQYLGTFILFVFGSVGALLLGSWLVIKGELTVGQLVAVEIVVSGMMANLVKFGKYIESGYDVLASYDKLESLFNVPHADADKTKSLRVDSIQRISLENIVYAHPKLHAKMGKALFFNGIEVSAGQKVSIFGRSGAGKSTLANILCGFKEFDKGDYLVNGVSIHEFSREEVFDRFFLLEKPSLFKGTVLENIILQESEEGKNRLMDILDAFPYSRDIFNLENGLSTQVYGLEGEFSDRLMTLISLARAIYASPDYLVIDQTFDGLHKDFSRGLIQFIEERYPDMAVIVLTSDEYIRNCFKHQITLGEP